MKRTQILSAVCFALIVAGPACSAKFVQIGDEDAGTAGVKCVYNGVTHNAGTNFKSSDGCNTCTCANDGTVACTLMACGIGVGGGSGVAGGASVGCLYNGVNYAVGSSFKASDGCNSCSCTNFGVACTTMGCAVGGASGAGGSTGVTCTSCPGPTPGIANEKCWDGSLGGPICEANSTGVCAWTIRACPPNPASGGASGAGGSTGISNCSVAADCKGALPALCQICADGTSGCAHFACNSGICQVAYCDGTTGAGGASGAGGSSGVGCSIVPLPMPDCGTMKPILTYDANGCPVKYTCPACPAVPVAMPNCGANVKPIATTDVNGCLIGYACPTCPAIDLSLPNCSGNQPITIYDATGCVTGYKCPGCATLDIAAPACGTVNPVPVYNIDGCATSYVCPGCPTTTQPALSCAKYQTVTDPATGCASYYICEP